jgi:RNA polymerase sigma-70 factor (ECF subfamily)
MTKFHAPQSIQESVLADAAEDSPDVIFERYSARLVVLAEKHLGARLARRVQGEDIVQSVFRTFFRRAGEGQFKVDSSADLWCLLSAITLRKVRSKAREHRSRKRDVCREAGDEGLRDAPSRIPGPEDAVVFVDLLEVLLQGTGDTHREILLLRLAGHTQDEIAKKVGLTRQTIHRVISGLKDKLQRMGEL